MKSFNEQLFSALHLRVGTGFSGRFKPHTFRHFHLGNVWGVSIGKQHREITLVEVKHIWKCCDSRGHEIHSKFEAKIKVLHPVEQPGSY